MKRKIIISLICLMTILAIGQVSYAAVEIVPSKNGLGTDAIVNTTISNSYLLCQGMKNQGESLYGTTVLPHLATNKDWGAVSYLSNSIYGTNTLGQANGIEVTINGVKYYSTTNNITGVMNWGSNPNVTRYTQTAGVVSSYDNSTATEQIISNIAEIYNNIDTRFVEKIGSGYSTDGMGFSGFYNSIYRVGSRVECPISLRTDLFGVYIGSGANDGGYVYYDKATGAAHTVVTFRPVIWNK